MREYEFTDKFDHEIHRQLEPLEYHFDLCLGAQKNKSAVFLTEQLNFLPPTSLFQDDNISLRMLKLQSLEGIEFYKVYRDYSEALSDNFTKLQDTVLFNVSLNSKVTNVQPAKDNTNRDIIILLTSMGKLAVFMLIAAMFLSLIKFYFF